VELRLPPGYYLELDADVAILRREDGRSVATFSARGVVWEAIERIAWEDYRGGSSTEASRRHPESGSHRRQAPTRGGRPPSPPRPPG
jgi:hypothetical protein